MNKVILMGRLTKDPEIRYSQGENSTPIARYTLAVPRNGKGDTTDFLEMTAFGKNAEFSEKYLQKGGKYLFEAHATRNDYTDKNGVKHFNNVVFVVDHIEFASSSGDTKKNNTTETQVAAPVEAPSNNSAPAEEEQAQQDMWSGDLGTSDFSGLDIY